MREGWKEEKGNFLIKNMVVTHAYKCAQAQTQYLAQIPFGPFDSVYETYIDV